MGFFSGLKSKDKTVFPWIELTSSDQLHTAIENSTDQSFLIFKHSTRCSISSMAKSRFENNWTTTNENCDIYYLDLLAHRDISNEIEKITGTIHQSPQVIVIKNKEVIYTDSHSNIDAKLIEQILTN